jgi:hypothetical protein
MNIPNIQLSTYYGTSHKFFPLSRNTKLIWLKIKWEKNSNKLKNDNGGEYTLSIDINKFCQVNGISR